MGFINKSAARLGNKSHLLCWHCTEKKLKIFFLLNLLAGIISVCMLVIRGVYLQTTQDLASPLFYSLIAYIQNGLLVAIAVSVSMAITSKRIFWKIAADGMRNCYVSLWSALRLKNSGTFAVYDDWSGL